MGVVGAQVPDVEHVASGEECDADNRQHGLLAFARISGREFDNPVMSIPLMPLLLLAFAASIVVTAFTVGDRMRRDTEGLV